MWCGGVKEILDIIILDPYVHTVYRNLSHKSSEYEGLVFQRQEQRDETS